MHTADVVSIIFAKETVQKVFCKINQIKSQVEEWKRARQIDREIKKRDEGVREIYTYVYILGERARDL